LVAGNPAAYLPNLAGSVNNLAIRLAEAGRTVETGAHPSTIGNSAIPKTH